METTSPDKSLMHRLFEVGVVVKGIHGVVDFIGAAIIYVVSGTTMLRILESVTSGELSDDPNDFLANYILNHAHITAQGKDFAALYLCVSGIINIIIAIGLFLHRKYMFPVAKILLGCFVLYQMYHFVRFHSPWLLILIIYDISVIGLIYLEYRRRWPNEAPTTTT